MFLCDQLFQARPGRLQLACAQLDQLGADLQSDRLTSVTCWTRTAGLPTRGLVVTSSAGTLDDLARVKVRSLGALDRLACSSALGRPAAWLGDEESVWSLSSALEGPILATIQMTARDGQLTGARSWAVDALEHLVSLTGVSAMVSEPVAREVSTLIWRVSFDSAEVQRSIDARLGTDATWIELQDAAREHFCLHQTTRSMSRRIGPRTRLHVREATPRLRPMIEPSGARP